MEIVEDDVEVTLSDNLRDIFAFDQNTFIGKGNYSGSGVFLLSRRIHYIYIYSSISGYVHVGDTQAPLLPVIPFQATNSSDNKRVKNFKLPMYLSLLIASLRLTLEFMMQLAN